jgi:hypothetical protein
VNTRLSQNNPPSGHVVIIVSLPDQKVSVYRGGKRIARAPVSTERNSLRPSLVNVIMPYKRPFF